MKKVNIALITLAILGSSFAYADCPALNTIYVDRDDHYVAQGLGGLWKGSDTTHGIPISPEDTYYGVGATPDSTRPMFAYEFACLYTHKDGSSFNLVQPSPMQHYELKGDNWQIWGPGFWVCYIKQSVTECQFGPPQEN